MDHSMEHDAQSAQASPGGAPAHAATPDRDPVCGMTVKPDSPHRHTYQGREYLFCSAGCRTKFAADPERYLAAPGSEPHGDEGTFVPMTSLSRGAMLSAAPAHESGVQWTCPMHPEIVRDAPGSCPIC